MTLIFQFLKVPLTLLIETDVPELLCPVEYRKGVQGKPIAIITKLGWSLLGPSLSPSVKNNCTISYDNVNEDYLRKDLERF